MNNRILSLLAVKLARRRAGVTAFEVAKRGDVSLRAAQRLLAALEEGWVLGCAPPKRQGAHRGDWRNVYYRGRWPLGEDIGTRGRPVLAVEMSRRYGLTAPKLAERARCSVRTAQRILAALVADGVLLRVGCTYRDPATEARRRASMRQARGKALAEHARVMQLIHNAVTV